MALFRAEDRLPEDNRILKIKDPVEFSLFAQREQLKISGIVCPYDPFTKEDVEIITDFARDFYKSAGQRPWFPAWREGAEQSIPSSAPVALRKTFPVLRLAFVTAMNRLPASIDIYANNQIPGTPHVHEPALNYSYLKQGPICVNELGESYSIATRHMIMIGEDLSHMAQQGCSEADPRLTGIAISW